MGILTSLGLVLVIGLVGGLISRRLTLPSITGYVVVGLLLAPTVSGAISLEAVQAFEPITSTSLAVIAYLIGTSLNVSTLRSLGKSISWITLLQCFGGFVAVALGLMLVAGYVMPGYTVRETYLPFGLLMGAIAAATAPPAILAIVRELRAKGPMTTTLLAVVALDDAVAVIIFAVAAAYSGVLMGTSDAGSMVEVIAEPVFHLGGAVVLGVATAFLMVFIARFSRSREMALVLVLGMVLLSYSLAEMWGMSGIIACMTLGFVIGNRRASGDLVVAVDEVQAVLFTMFFVISGLHFDAASFALAGPFAAVVVVTRCIGKYAGARLGGIIGHAPPKVGENIGLALMPQAGVSVGLVLIAASSFPDLANAMVSATLASVIINELITPPMAKAALVRSGEARIDGKDEPQGGAAARQASSKAVPTPVTPAEEQGSMNEYHTASGPLAVRTSTSHLHESPWTRSQRARDRASRDR
ncbi:MAG: cation:proton antiporter [Dehalococcoidia bacterium]|nr:cation:proton antiporter [Dehalococcoidia bacterium]